MPDLEAVGDAATGSLLGRAVEPDAGEGDGHTDESRCLNCGCELAGDYCHCCGQRAHVHRTIAAFWRDLMHGVLHFEGKVWRTLPLLAWKPGELTRRYIDGERAKFVSPIALFLFTFFLMFAVFSAIGVGLDTGNVRNVRADVEAAIEEEAGDLAKLREERAELAASKGDAAELAETEARIRQTEQGIAALRRFLASGSTGTSDLVGATTGWPALDAGLKKLNANPALALYKIQTNAYKFAWALIPISVPFVWLLFLHRRRYRRFNAYDHTVFATYSITFMSMTLVAVALLQAVPGTELIRSAMIVIPPLHIYRQLRGAYGLSRWSAGWRTVVLLIFANIAIALFLALLLVIGALG